MSLPTAEAALDAFDEPFFVLDGDNRLVEWNASVDETTGDLSLADRPVTTLFSDSDADAILQGIEQATESGDATVEARLASTDGAYEFEIARLDDGRIAVFGRDVSERRSQRRQLETRERVLKRMHDVIADSERSFDEQVRALLTLAREELGLPAGSLSRAQATEMCFEIVDGEGPISEGESLPIDETFCDETVEKRETLALDAVGADPTFAARRTHTERGIACYLGAPVFLDDEVYGAICVFGTESRATEFSAWDVTLVDLIAQWVSYELRRRRDTEQLRRQNEKLERFASIVSHDLRNPLNVLEGSIELAAETGEDEHFRRAENAVARMESLIDDLLLLARAGDAIDGTEPVSLAAVARDAWTSVDTGAATLTIETETTVLADRTRLRQLLENLFRNSVEHGAASTRPGDAVEHGLGDREDDDPTQTPTTDGGKGVGVTVGDLTDDGRVTGFFVADDGVGIAEEIRDDVFESGFSTADRGTGFGLSIVAEIAAAHEWVVALDESETGGVRFEFTGVEVVAHAEN